MPRFLHAADVHLDSPLRGVARYEGAPVDALRGATRHALDNLVELARAERVDFVVLAGDLYDGDWRDYRTGLFFASCMSRLREADIPVVLVHGNHDAASQITRRLRLPDNVHVLPADKPGSVELEAAGAAVHGQGYARRETTEDLARGYPAAVPGALNVGLLHTSLDGRVGHEPYAPTSLDVLAARGYGYWALGHVHAREEVAREPWVVFPGNLQGRHARETGPKGATLVTYADGEVRAVEPRALDVLRWARVAVDAGACEDPDAVFERGVHALEDALAASEGRPVAARVELVGATRAHAALCADTERVVNQLRAAAVDAGDVWIEKVVFATRDAGGDALGEELEALLRSAGALAAGDARLAELSGELAPLQRKLAAAHVDVDLGPAALHARLAEAVGLLRGRLGAPEEEQGA